MNNNITINKRALESHIEKLRKIRNNMDTDATLTDQVQDVEGSGDTIALINEIDCIYKCIVEDYKTLVNNSIQFFENVLNSASKADEDAEKLFK